MSGIDPARRILVVDDDFYMRKFLHDLLAFQGYAPQVLETAEDALTVLKEGGGASLIIADDSMAEMTGSELVIALRKAGIGVPAIVLGPIDNPSWSPLGSDLGRVEVLDKPFHSAQLVSAIDRMLTL